MTDADRLDWLEKQFGIGLINDDNGHWAISGDGVQNVPMSDEPVDIDTTFFIAADDWFETAREAIDNEMERIVIPVFIKKVK